VSIQRSGSVASTMKGTGGVDQGMHHQQLVSGRGTGERKEEEEEKRKEDARGLAPPQYQAASRPETYPIDQATGIVVP